MRCHNSVYTIDILALSGNEQFDTRTLIKSSRRIVSIFSRRREGVECTVIASRLSACLWCIRHLVCTRWMKLTWASGYPLHRHWFSVCFARPMCLWGSCCLLRFLCTDLELETKCLPRSTRVPALDEILDLPEYVWMKSFTICFGRTRARLRDASFCENMQLNGKLAGSFSPKWNFKQTIFQIFRLFSFSKKDC